MICEQRGGESAIPKGDLVGEKYAHNDSERMSLREREIVDDAPPGVKFFLCIRLVANLSGKWGFVEECGVSLWMDVSEGGFANSERPLSEGEIKDASFVLVLLLFRFNLIEYTSLK